jgi:hypothetical protein
MSKVEHVSRLIHRRDGLLNRREEIAQELAQVDQGIAAIDSEIERAWQGAAPSPTPILLSSLMANMQKHAPGADEDFDEDEDEDEADEDLEDSESHADRVLAMLRRSSVLDYGRAAIEIYNENTPQTRKRVRATLSYLKRSNRIRNRARNEWEVLMS